MGVDRDYTPRVQPEHDIDRLILELNATQPPEPAQVTPGSTTRLDRWLQLVADKGGSDLLLVAGAPPSVRVKGTLVPLAEGPLDGVDIEEAVLPALPPHARRQYRDSRIADASYRLPGLGAFPHQSAPRTRPRRRCGAHAARASAAARLAGPAAAGGTARAAAAWPGADRRADRLRQEHDAGRPGRGDQPPRRPGTSSPSKTRSSTSTRTPPA